MINKILLPFFVFVSIVVFAQVEFNPKGGNYVNLSEVNITIPDGYTVYFTIDGTVPSKQSKKVSSSSIQLSQNTVFRFAIYAPNSKRTEEVHSYIINRKHSLPIVSLVTDPAHFFDSLTGIYVKGCCADSLPPFKGANFWKEWERPVHFEYIDTSGRRVLLEPAGMRIFGGYSKGNPQKSLALFARKKYGNNRFKYPFFPDQPTKKYKNVVLRNAGGDMLGAHIRDVYATQLLEKTGLLIQAYQPVVVYLNGVYWGKYNLREKINEHFIHTHFGYDKDSLIIMRHNGDRQHGPPSDYRKFIKKLQYIDLKKKEHLKYVAGKMDIDNYMLYNIAEVYTGNGDAGGNIRYFKSMADTAKWRWIFYDLDQGMNLNSKNDYKDNTLEKFTTLSQESWPNPPWSTLIIRKLLENDSLRNVYINRFCDLLNTTFAPKRALKLLDKLEREVQEEIPYHLKRWRVRQIRYSSSWDYLKHFAENRPNELFLHLQQRFDLNKSVVIKIKVDGKKGRVKWNSLNLKKNFEGQYFSGVSCHLEAIPMFDFVFKGWKNCEYKQQDYVQIPEVDTLYLEPVFEKRERSKYAKLVMFSEISAKQTDAMNSKDWVELYSSSKDEIDLSNWLFLDENDDALFVFPEKSKIYPDSFVILTQNKVYFEKFYGTDLSTIGSFDFGLGIGGDKIRLYDADTNLVDYINFNYLIELTDYSMNWAKMDYRFWRFHKLNWKIEQPSPGYKSKAHKELKKKERTEKWIKGGFFYTGISIALAALFLFFFSLRKDWK